MNDGWAESTLGEVAQVVGGGTPSTKVAEYWGGDVLWLSPTEVVRQDGQRIATSERTITKEGLAASSAKLLPRNTVIVTSRASVGFTAIADVELATNQGFQSLIAGPNLLPEFLMYWVQANRDEFRSRAGGSTFPEISKTKVKSIPITYPPLPVQRRILDLMGHLDTHLERLRAEREASRTWLSALATRQWEESIPRRTLGEIGRTVTGATPKTGTAEYWDSPDIPFVTPGDLDDVRRLQTAARFVSESGAKTARELPLDSVLVVCIGATIGKVAVSARRCITNQQINAVVGLNRPDALFLATVLGATRGRRALVDAAGQTAVPILSKSKFERIRVPWPPADIRAESARVIEGVIESRDAVATEIRTLSQVRDRLLNSILSRQTEIPESYDTLLGVG